MTTRLPEGLSAPASAVQISMDRQELFAHARRDALWQEQRKSL